MKTDHLIEMLAQDAPVRGQLSTRLAGAILAGGVAAAIAFEGFVGIRPDFVSAGQSARFVFKILFVVCFLYIAVGMAMQVGRPDAQLGRWRIAFAALLLALGIASATELLVTPPGFWTAQLVGRNAAFCLVVIPALALAPLIFLLFALRAGAPSRPGLAGAVAGLTASGIATVLYAAHCPDDSPLFVATWYSLATALVTAAGYVAGLRLLRW